MAAILVLAAWNGQAPIVVLTSLLFSTLWQNFIQRGDFQE